jgi:signal peptidase
MANYELASRKLLHDRARARSRRHWYEFLALIAVMVTWYFTLAPSSLNGPVTYTVISGHSMEPSLYTGDLVMVRKQADYKVGDTVLTEVMGGLVMHRIVWLDKTSVRTQGVNNDFEDTWTLPRSAILGKQEFVLKQAGTYLVNLRTNPLYFGLFAAALGSLLLFDFRKKKNSKRLEEILKTAEREVQQKTKSYLNTFLTGLYVLAGVSLVSTGALLARHAVFFPNLLLSLIGLVVSIIAFEVLGIWIASGKDLEEPDRSIAVFKKRLYRIDSSVHIDGLTKPVESASQLMNFADIANTPILHLVLNEGNLHRFLVVTDELNYVFTVDLEKKVKEKARHKA